MFCIFWIKQVLQFCNAKFLLLYSSLLVARTFQCSELHLHWNMKLLSFTFAFFSCWCNFLFFSSTFRSLEVFSTPGEFGVVRRAFHRKTGQQVAAPRHVFFQHLCLTVVHRWLPRWNICPKPKKVGKNWPFYHSSMVTMLGWKCLVGVWYVVSFKDFGVIQMNICTSWAIVRWMFHKNMPWSMVMLSSRCQNLVAFRCMFQGKHCQVAQTLWDRRGDGFRLWNVQVSVNTMTVQT